MELTLEQQRALALAQARLRLQQQATPQEQQPPADSGNWADAFVGQGVLMGAGDEMKAAARAGVRDLFGNNPGQSYGDLYNQELQDTRSSLKDFQTRHPVLSPALEMAGAVATTPFIPGGAAAKAAGMGARVARGAATGAGYGAIYGGASSDGDLTDRAKGALTGAGAGAAAGTALPLAVRGVQAAGRGVRDYVAGPVVRTTQGLLDRDKEAATRIGMAMKADAAVPQPLVTPADEAVAAISGGPLLNIDRGGEAVRALARSSANTSPTGRAILNNAIDDRFASQSDRAMATVRRIVNGSGATVELMQRDARAANKGNYKLAYQAGDKPIWSPVLEQLTSSPAVVDAMRAAAQRGKDRAVTEGFGGFNPGVQVDPSGLVTFAKGKTGVPTYPNLQYWDYVKRELDDAVSKARRTGAKEEASTLSGLVDQLRSELDRQVPLYKNARAGAAAAFGSQDAMSAGEEFVTSRMDNAKARAALGKMSAPDQKLFAEGFGTKLAAMIAETKDRRNAIGQLFASPAQRERIEMALGPDKAKEFEAYLRVEALMDKARTATQGNSSTARQLAELGLAGGGAGYLTGEWKIPAGLLAGWILKKGMGRIDRNVAQRVAEALASPDPAILQQGLQRVARSDQLMAALRLIDVPSTIGTTQAVQQPLRGYLGSDQRTGATP